MNTNIQVFFNGKPFHGKAAFINGYNGYKSTDTDGCLCALIKDNSGKLSCWNNDGKPNIITNENGKPIIIKNRRGTKIELNGTLNISNEDLYVNENNKQMDKKVIRLTESELHNIIKESVKNILKEIGDTEKGQYILGKLHNRQETNDDKNSINTSHYAFSQRADKAQNVLNDTNDKTKWVNKFNDMTNAYQCGNNSVEDKTM